jgi:hypothetical protein
MLMSQGPVYKDENGEFHRLDGPAIISKNGQSWFKHGKRHRLDGPAIKTNDGFVAYFVNGQQLSREEFLMFVDPITGNLVVPLDHKFKHDPSCIWLVTEGDSHFLTKDHMRDD